VRPGIQRALLGKAIPLAVIACLAILSFQNCIGSSNNESQSVSQAPGNGNGQGYDGKLYLHDLTDAFCSDGTSTDSKIGLKLFSMLLLRENCIDIPGGRAIEGAISADGWSILYNGKIYYLFGSGNDKALGQKPVAIVEDGAGNAFYVDEQVLARVDAGKSLLWARSPVPVAGSSFAFSSGALNQPTELAAIGTVTSKDSGGTLRTAGLVTFIDTGGSSRLSRTYSLGSSTSLTTRFESIATDGAGALYITGWVDRDPTNHQLSPFVLKLAADGSVVWQRTLAAPSDKSNLTSRVVLSTTGAVLARLGNQFVSVTADGTVSWSMQLTDPDGRNHAIYSGIAPSFDGGLLLVGRNVFTSGGAQATSALLARIDAFGAVSNAQNFAIGGMGDQAFEEVAERTDKSIFVHGHWIGQGGTIIYYRTIASFTSNLTYVWGFGMLAGVNGFGAMAFAPGVSSSSVWIVDSSGYFHTVDRGDSTQNCPLCYPKDPFQAVGNTLQSSTGSAVDVSVALTASSLGLLFNDARDAFKFK
jgi:hypothetical protein